MKSGKLPKGSQLPPEGELAEMRGISRSTLRESLGHLETHGLVTRQQGCGTFITAQQGPGFQRGFKRLEPFRSIADQAGKKHKVIHRHVDQVEANPEIQAELELNLGCQLLRVQVIEAIDGIRSIFMEDYLITARFDHKDILGYQGSMLTDDREEKTCPFHTSTR
jgi:GntR family transcriptional regulator